MAKRPECAAIRSRNELNYFMVPVERENAELRRENAELRRENARLKGQPAKPGLALRKELDDAGVWQWRIARRSVTPA
jgi:hypothetical protein